MQQSETDVLSAQLKSKIVSVIPAWNEEGNIGRVVADIPRDLCPTVIVVDNASTDRTAEVARAAGAIVVRQLRRGYGYACAAGVAEAYRRGACSRLTGRAPLDINAILSEKK